MEPIYLFGTSTTAKRVKSFIEYHNLYKIEGFIVDDEYKNDSFFEGLPLLSITEFRSRKSYKEISVFICLAWNRLNQDRKEVFEKYKDELKLVNIISPNAILRGCVIGKNNWIGDYTVLEVGSTIHNNCIMDHLCFVGTNSIIEDHSYIAVKAMIAGDSIVGSQSFIGINATIFDQINIGKKCIISGGEIIKRNIRDNTVVKTIGNVQVFKSYSPQQVILKLVASKNVR